MAMIASVKMMRTSGIVRLINAAPYGSASARVLLPHSAGSLRAFLHACAVVFFTLAVVSYTPQTTFDEHPVLLTDVAVIGGTPAGVAAALAAARRGDHVVLVTLRPYRGGARARAPRPMNQTRWVRVVWAKPPLERSPSTSVFRTLSPTC